MEAVAQRPGRRMVRPPFLQPAHQNKNEQHNNNEPEPAATVVAGPVEGAAANTTEATEKGDDQDDENDCADAHLKSLLEHNARYGTKFLSDLSVPEASPMLSLPTSNTELFCSVRFSAVCQLES